MSGFEVIGVVLGVLPLLVEGLKSYQDGLKTASHMIKYEKTIQGLVLAFSVDSSRYMHVCERLLQPLMLDTDEWSELVDNPGGQAWQQEELGHQIIERLGRDYWTFTHVAQRLHQRLLKFALKLELDPENSLKPKWMSGSQAAQSTPRERFFARSNQTWKGLKAGFKNGSLESALEQIEADLDRLEKLLDANEREAPMRREKRRRGNAKVWQNIREAAKNMYAALAAHWQCPPTHRHTASLRLESREADDQKAVFRFGLVISFDDTACQPQQLLWRELEIEPTLTAAATQLSISTAQGQPASTGNFKVSFMATAPTIVLTQPPRITTVSNAATNQRIQNLCHWQHIQQVDQDIKLGFLEHQLWHHHLFRCKESRNLPADLCLLSLRDCVTSRAPAQAASIFSNGLSTKEKYHIASVLASSVLQLANTPWLPGSTWDLEQVFLLQLQQRALTTANAYLQRDFYPSTAVPQTKSSPPLIENQLVFALGVMLIELAFQQPLAKFQQVDDLDPQGNAHAYTELQVANRLSKDLNSMEGEKYADAARRCVKCNFDVQDCSLDNVEFQDQFYRGVVLPLQELKRALD